MAYDGIVTNKIVSELNNTLIGGKINKIYEPNKNELLFSIYSHGVNYCLNISIASDSYRLNLTTHAKNNPQNALNFCMLLRKHLIGSKITNIYTNGLERIIFIELESYNELNDLVKKKLIVELMGKHSNVILTNEKNNIIDSLRHLSIEEKSNRDILPARPYILPENTKQDFLQIKTFDEFYKIITSSNSTNLDNAISNAFIGFSKLFIQNLIEELNIDNTINTKNLKVIYNYISDLLKNINSFCVQIKSYKNDFSIFYETNINNLQSENTTNNLSNLQTNFFIDDFYSDKETNQLFITYRNNVLKLVSNILTKIKKKLVHINEKTEECKNMDYYQLCGELITANLYKYPSFSEKFITVENYYNNNELITISVDDSKTPSYNAKQYYKKYNKLKNTLSIVQEQKRETNLELHYLESIIYEIENCHTISDIDEIYAEISENPMFEKNNLKSNSKTLKQKQKNKKLDKTYVPIEYKIEDYTLLIGKNNLQNDYLTTKIAKSNDIWFHTKDIHGSHAILLTKGTTPPIEVIIKCAQIAAYYSKARQSSNVPVDYTPVKYVKKPSGSKPGFVIYTHNQTINVQPNAQ